MKVRIWTFEGEELDRLRRALADARMVRFAFDEGRLKYKANETMWTAGYEPDGDDTLSHILAETEMIVHEAVAEGGPRTSEDFEALEALRTKLQELADSAPGEPAEVIPLHPEKEHEDR